MNPSARPTTYRYGPDRSQVADLWLPGGSGPHPVVVVLHGGFWRARYGRQLMNPMSADLAERGWAAWSLEYRRVGDGGGWPETFADVGAGIDGLGLAAAAGHDLDFDRIVAVGHSAGGHLALWAAARSGLPVGAPGAVDASIGTAVRVRAVVALAAVSDLIAAAGDGVGGLAIPRLMGGWPNEVPDRYTLGSPAARLPLGVPQLLVHGEDDRDVPVELSRRYAAEASSRGDAVTLAVLADTGHMELIDSDSPAWTGPVVSWLESGVPWLGSGWCKEGDPDP